MAKKQVAKIELKKDVIVNTDLTFEELMKSHLIALSK